MRELYIIFAQVPKFSPYLSRVFINVQNVVLESVQKF
jgi:hypothetical protein